MNTRANPATRDRLGLVLVVVTVIVMVTVGYFAHLHRTRQKHCQGKLQKRRNRRSGDRMFKLRDNRYLPTRSLSRAASKCSLKVASPGTQLASDRLACRLDTACHNMAI